MQAKVLLQTLMGPRFRPVRQVGGNRIGGLRDRTEAFTKLRTHEALDLGNAATVDARRDVDQHQRGKHLMSVRRTAVGEQRRHAAERRAYHRRTHSRRKDGVASLAYSRRKDGVASLAYSRPKDGVASVAYAASLS